MLPELRSKRTRSRCFQLQLSRLLPSHNFLPESFGEGFPSHGNQLVFRLIALCVTRMTSGFVEFPVLEPRVDVAPRWHGIWQPGWTTKTACCLVCLQFTSKNQGVVLSASNKFFHVRQVIGKCPSPASATTDIFFGESQPGRGPCLRLHGLGETNSASVRFQRPLVLPQLVIGIDTLVAGTQRVK